MGRNISYMTKVTPALSGIILSEQAVEMHRSNLVSHLQPQFRLTKSSPCFKITQTIRTTELVSTILMMSHISNTFFNWRSFSSTTESSLYINQVVHFQYFTLGLQAVISPWILKTWMCLVLVSLLVQDWYGLHDYWIILVSSSFGHCLAYYLTLRF